jgi:transposase
MSIVQTDKRRRRMARKVSFRAAPLEAWTDEWRALDARLEPDHLARLINRALSRLDLSPLWAAYAGFGSTAYPPDRLLAAVLFETQRGHPRPAQWHRHAKESDPLRWLLRGFVPSRRCWYQFRDRVGPELLGLVHQAVRQAIDEGLTPANRAALDGTLVAANASRHKLLKESVLTQRCQKLSDAVAADERGVPLEEPPRWLAATVRGRRRQAARYHKASDEMARRQQRNRQKRASKRTAAERIVIAPWDAEAALGRDKEKVFRPLYNVQLLDDLDSPLILGWLVAAQPNDAGLMGPVLRQAKEGLGVTIKTAVADAGYAGGADLAEAKGLGATVYAPWQENDFTDKKEKKYYKKEEFTWLPQEQSYVCPQGERLSYQGSSQQKRSGTEKIELQMYRAQQQSCAACCKRGKCTPGKGARTISRSEYEEHVEGLRERMKTEEAKRLYKLRKQTVELANADMKEHRALRKLYGLGLKRAAAQVGLTVLAHDLVVLDGLRRKREKGAERATPSPPSC